MQIATVAITSRLLAPEEFGRYAVLQTIYLVLSLIVGAGISLAIVVGPEQTQREIQGIAHHSLRRGGIIAIATAVLAEPFNQIFKLHDSNAVRIFALTLLVFPCKAVFRALLQREKKFTRLAQIDLASNFLGTTLLTIALVKAGFGLVSIVAGMAFTEWLSATLMHMTLDKRINFIRPAPLPRKFKHQSITLAKPQILFALGANLDRFLLGQFGSMVEAGYYSRAASLAQNASGFASGAIDKIGLSYISAEQRLTGTSGTFRRITAILVAVGLYPVICAVVLRRPIVHILLGPGWSQAELPFALMTVAVYLRLFSKLVSAALQQKSPERLAGVGAAQLGLVLVFCFLAAPFGASWVALVNLILNGAFVGMLLFALRDASNADYKHFTSVFKTHAVLPLTAAIIGMWLNFNETSFMSVFVPIALSFSTSLYYLKKTNQL